MIILLVSSFVLIGVFILTLVFGIIRIVNNASDSLTTTKTVTNKDEAINLVQTTPVDKAMPTRDTYTLIEDVTKLIVELIAILLAILATFILYRYVKAKYAAVPTSEPKSTS